MITKIWNNTKVQAQNLNISPNQATTHTYPAMQTYMLSTLGSVFFAFFTLLERRSLLLFCTILDLQLFSDVLFVDLLRTVFNEPFVSCLLVLLLLLMFVVLVLLLVLLLLLILLLIEEVNLLLLLLLLLLLFLTVFRGGMVLVGFG